MPNLSQSKKDAIDLWNIFRQQLNWKDDFGSSVLITQNNNKNIFYETIGKSLKHLYDKIPEKGHNPYVVNFIQFSGHGFVNSKNEAVFTLPDLNSKAYRIINVDKLAENFAAKDKSINIFLYSACRSQVGTLNPNLNKIIEN